MKAFTDKLMNILLFPARFFESFTDNKVTLFLGMLLIGAFDLLLPNTGEIIKQLFTGKPMADVYYNIFITLLLIVVVGVIDVVFVGVPTFDFLNFLKKKETGDKAENLSIASRTKIMKAYIASHFVTIPVSTIGYYAFFQNLTVDSSVWSQNMYLGFFMVVFIWSVAILTRGCNTLFRFNTIFRKLTFILAFTWNYVFGLVFDMQILEWLFRLYR